MTSHRSPKSGDFGLYISALMLVFLAACQSQAAIALTSTATTSPNPTASPTVTSTPTLIPSPTATPTPAPTLFMLPTLDPQATLQPCDQRRPADSDLFSEVDANYGLDPAYVPGDLVRLGNYLPGRVTLPDMLLRQPAARALGKMVKDMLAVGLAPTVLSSYRSYFDQAVAHNLWVVSDPTNANEVSALPGHSEHQLGTAVDFGSPELPSLTGTTTDPFSTLFDQTNEGRWLAQHAFEYGFSLSSPPGAESVTGLAYEPWHYRYVGLEMAAYLHASGYYLDEYLLKVRPVMPCQP
ncbi:MAG: M15 family metallopeptidase [Anaerolineales bacterium]